MTPDVKKLTTQERCALFSDLCTVLTREHMHGTAIHMLKDDDKRAFDDMVATFDGVEAEDD